MKIKIHFNVLYLLIILLFSSFFVSPLFHPGVFETHDGENQLARFAAYYQTFVDGQFPARWAGNLNYGYGTPALIFFYPLPGYLASFIHLLGINFENSFKIILFSGLLLSGIFFYFWARLLFKKETALIGAFLYAFIPYHFLNLYVRGDVGEMLALGFVPLVFYSLEKLAREKQFKNLFLGGISYALLILSHNGVSLMFSPVFLLYGILKIKNKKTFLMLLLLFCLGLSLSAFFWIPALIEGKYVNAHLFIGQMYKDHFPSLMQLVYSNWGFGSDVKKADGLSPQIGFIFVIFSAISFFVFIKEKKKNVLVGFWLMIFLLSLFIMQPISTILWDNIKILRLYEFPWRFVGLASFASVVLGCYVLDKVKNTWILFSFLILFFISSIPFFLVRSYTSHADDYYYGFPGTTYYHGEASPIWTAGDPGEFPKSTVEVVEGRGTIKDIKKKSQLHTYTVESKETVTVADNTHYFPGWKVLVDDNEVPIQFQDPNHRGLITFQVPQGKHSIKVVFEESKIRLFADSISLFAIFFVAATLLPYRSRIRFNFKKS